MDNLKSFTDNLAVNPYTHRSYSMKINTDLLTANKSIIRAINEVYTNQQSILNSILILYRKLNITLGDIVTDKELKEAYNDLEFANVLDGLIKLNNKIDNLSSSAINHEIQEIQNILNTSSEDVDNIFNTMNWASVVDALIKINKRISDYIVDDTTDEAEEYTQIRDSISNIIAIIGSSDETAKNKLQSKFSTIINAINTMDAFLGADETSLQTLNDNGFISASHAIIEFNDRLNTSLDDVNTLKTNQTENINNFNRVDETIQQLAHDLQTLANSMGQATGTDLSNLGYDSIADGLEKLTSASNKLNEIIGDLDSNEEYITRYKELGYDNIIETIMGLSSSINQIAGSITTETLEVINAAGYTDAVDALVNIINLLGNTEENMTTFTNNNFTTIIGAINTLKSNISNLESQLSGSGNSLTAHNADLTAHPNAISGYFRHKTNHEYTEGEIVFIPELPNNLCLLCVRTGVSGRNRPNFAAL